MKAETATEVALARSAAYGLLAHAFRYPDSEHWAMFFDRRRWRGWPEVLNQHCPDAGGALQRVREKILSPDRSISIDSVQADFARLFGHSVGGACPLYELEYGAGEVFARVARLADLQGFYSAFGLELDERLRERADHLSVEFEFMSVMAAKEGFAEQQQEIEGLDTVRDSTGRFLEAHLGRWLPAVARRIVEADPAGFYGRLGDFAGKFIRGECERYGVSPGSRLLEVRSADEEDETVQACAAEQPGVGCPTNSSGSARRMP